MQLRCPLVLASRSPRRRKLLEQTGVSFTVQVSPVDEVIPENTSPENIVRQLALEKAEAVAGDHLEAITLGADTIVVLNGAVLGKPVDETDAHRMLRMLSGNTHAVFTGLALVHPSSRRRITAHEKTGVTFAELTDAEISAYVATGSPMDKAGAYGIQDDLGALFISRIDGDYYNVVGLPLHRFYQTLKTSFSDLLLEP
jgi:septum formation protein